MAIDRLRSIGRSPQPSGSAPLCPNPIQSEFILIRCNMYKLPMPHLFPTPLHQSLQTLKRSLGQSMGQGLRLGAVTLGTWLATFAPAWSLTPTQLAEKLGGVPVFTIGIVEDNAVTFLEEPIQTPDGNEVSISRIYMNVRDAQADLEQIRTDNPTLPENVSVARISLGEIYCISQTSADEGCEQQAPPGDAPSFIYFPDREQLGAAINLLEEQGTEVGDNTPLFVPLFFAQVVTPERNTTVPIIYFSLKDLQCDIADAKAENAELSAAEFDVQVTTLGQILQQLRSPENANATEVRFVPIQRTMNAPCAAPN